jgi:hypothetical protein
MNVEDLLNVELVLFVSDEAVDECVKSVLLIVIGFVSQGVSSDLMWLDFNLDTFFSDL